MFKVDSEAQTVGTPVANAHEPLSSFSETLKILRAPSKLRKMAPAGRKPWWRIQWFADEDTHEERKLIVKLDLLIVPYAFLAYWTKYIDQANLSEWTSHLCCVLTRCRRGPAC